MRKRVRYSTGEYVNRHSPSVRANGVDSFWAMLKRGYHSTYHRNVSEAPALLRDPGRGTAQLAVTR